MAPKDTGRPRLTKEEWAARKRRQHEARTSQTYGTFLRRAALELGIPEPESERTVVAVLSTLDRRLPWDEMADLAAQLPEKLRELLATCDEPEQTPSVHEIHEAEFLGMVARDLGISPEEADERTRAVFRVLSETVTHGEIEDVVHLLPKDLRALWPGLH